MFDNLHYEYVVQVLAMMKIEWKLSKQHLLFPYHSIIRLTISKVSSVQTT